jgi:DNA-binding HxlR family transcriptional regulator
MTPDLQDTERRHPRRFKVDPRRGVAKVIGEEVRKFGSCTLTIRMIGKRAGISKRTVDRQLAEMIEHGMIERECKRWPGEMFSPPNTYRITSRTWLDALGLA